MLLTALAYTWLQQERRRAGTIANTADCAGRHHQVLTAHLFVTHPHYLETMMKLKDFHLRI